MAKKATGSAKKNVKTVYFEAAVVSDGWSMFTSDTSLNPENLDKLSPPQERCTEAAKALKDLGFTIRHIGTFSISGEGSRKLWERVFGTKVQRRSQLISEAHPNLGEMSYLCHKPDTPFEIPPALKGLVERAYPQRPPTFYESPLPPRVDYHHLQVPSDVSMILRSDVARKNGVTGKGVLVAMVDSGFYKHPFYSWHGYNYNATLAPDATDVDQDASGHGTAEAANIFASAPDIDFIGVKMGGNATLAFKTASDLHPAIITNSWGYEIRSSSLPNSLLPLQTAVIEAVAVRGITVCFSAGNGQWGWPGQMPQVISVGGVFAHDGTIGDDFDLEASNYASSFDSNLYPGRHVPDVCGLVGMQPRGIYIMLPVPPQSQIDNSLAGGTFPNNDQTAANDGWAVISGTSASSPQIAGICALIKQLQPGISPTLMKSILRASARDVTSGQSNNGQPAGNGHDGATGAGLVDANVACQLARSVKIRNRLDLPSPV